MDLTCPKCLTPVPTELIDVENGVALCFKCHHACQLTDLLDTQTASALRATRPPKGAWFHRSERGFDVGSTTRHVSALFFVPFLCFWSSAVLGGLYGTQIQRGKLDLVQSLVGIPFLIITLILWLLALISVCGKASIQVEDGRGVAFIGLGKFGWKRHFQWNDVTSVRDDITYAKGDNTGAPTHHIILEAKTKIRFIGGLNEERTSFIISCLREMLKARV